jgi:DNA polymerase (family 10)
MPRSNQEVAGLLQEMAELQAITGRDPFRIRSYEKAAAAVAAWPKDVKDLDLKGLLKIPSVGSSMASRIEEWIQTGRINDLEMMREQVPPGVREMMRIQGLGPKRAAMLHQELGISTVEELVEAAKAHRLAGIKGLGTKMEESILKGVAMMAESDKRVLLDVGLAAAEEVIAALRSMSEIVEIECCGSVRRMRETIGDIDILVASHQAKPIMDAFTALPFAGHILAHGDTKSAIVTEAGLQVDLRVVSPDAWGAALIYFTGSKDHNIKIREMAVRKGLKLSEYGLFRLDDDVNIAAHTEAEVYEALGIGPVIPPPMREDTGEVEAALAGTLPAPVVEGDLRGDLHTHTTFSDGHASLEEMLAAAAARGYAYYAVTDHAAELLPMHRTTKEGFLEQRARIDKLRRRFPKMEILHGVELNIYPDGGVDYPEEFLAGFDITVASIHSHFNLDKDAMTKRLLAAMENPNVNIIGHPTARLIGRRQPVEFDMEAVAAAAAKTGTALELNAFPDRLDLRDDNLRVARSAGATVSIDTDSHAVGHLGHMRYGAGTAQRGWITKAEVLNTKTLKQVQAFVARKRR